jgi:hypothetical protein
MITLLLHVITISWGVQGIICRGVSGLDPAGDGPAARQVVAAGP